ncbi:MAG: hypothetical protein HC763_22370, partial [Hydrococcus sp. CRU_1_1]|nr:hypothetical protein [Hydrococcus sp. CRU_1_1]
MLIVALIAGALYGVGRFLLPNTLEVTRTAAIERPRASVFAMINDLRIAKEWSPYYARDPDADYAFNGDPGQGQSMRWISADSRASFALRWSAEKCDRTRVRSSSEFTGLDRKSSAPASRPRARIFESSDDVISAIGQRRRPLVAPHGARELNPVHAR